MLGSAHSEEQARAHTDLLQVVLLLPQSLQLSVDVAQTGLMSRLRLSRLLQRPLSFLIPLTRQLRHYIISQTYSSHSVCV